MSNSRIRFKRSRKTLQKKLYLYCIFTHILIVAAQTPWNATKSGEDICTHNGILRISRPNIGSQNSRKHEPKERCTEQFGEVDAGPRNRSLKRVWIETRTRSKSRKGRKEITSNLGERVEQSIWEDGERGRRKDVVFKERYRRRRKAG